MSVRMLAAQNGVSSGIQKVRVGSFSTDPAIVLAAPCLFRPRQPTSDRTEQDPSFLLWSRDFSLKTPSFRILVADKYHVDTLQHLATMDHETLNNALAEASASSVAGHFGVNRRTIYRWCKSLGIPRRVYRCPDPVSLRRLEGAGILQRDIARTFGVCRWTVHLWCKKLGIAHHTTGRFRNGIKGNVRHIHEEMPFGVGVLFASEGSEVSNF